jgi:acyl-CoA synthetase (AMP-forming)/AMP-acid ligase II
MNLAELFLRYSSARPGRNAMILAEHRITYGELEKRVRAIQTGLRREGFRPGDRVVILVPVSFELYALLLALFSLGVVPVSLDSSMGLAKMLQALGLSKARALISVDRLLRYRFLVPRLWGMKLYSLDSDGIWLRPFSKLEASSADEFAVEERSTEDFALITYTSGSTGRPKGADRCQGILLAQHEISRELWPDAPDEVDMPCFPMVALQNLSCGITTVLPDVDFRALTSLNPAKVVAQLKAHGVTRLSGAPAFLKALTRHIIDSGEPLEWVRGLIAGGAPVPRWLCRDVLRAFPNAEAYVVYGSTEAEPMAFASMREVIDSPGEGYLVGKPIPQLELRIARETGEISVTGPHVIRRYLDNELANRETKIKDADGRIWHRTGDQGRIDDSGRVWITGRISDQVAVADRRYPNYVLEQRLEEIPGVARAAVLRGPRVFIERSVEGPDEDAIRQAIREDVDGADVEFLDALPVDGRHFWKIDRHRLPRA